MRKLFLMSFLFIVGLPFLVPSIFAQTPVMEDAIIKDIPVSEPLPILAPDDASIKYGYGGGYPAPYMQQGMYLLSVFDKKGTAQIATKIIFDTEEKEALQDFSFFIPGKDIVLSQIIHEKTIYKEKCDGLVRPMPDTIERSISSTMPYPDNCYETYVPVYTTYKPTIQEKPDGIQVSLSAKPDIEGKSQESLIFSYRSPSFTKNMLGSIQYDIETPRLPLTMSTVQVGVVAKEGLTIRGGPPMYGSGYVPSLRALEKSRTLTEEENQELSQVSNDIMYNGTVRKSDSDLAPNTSFEADGVYGSNIVALYTKEIIFGIVILILLVGGIVFAIKKFSGSHPTVRIVLIAVVVSIFSSALITISLAFIFILGRMRGIIPY